MDPRAAHLQVLGLGTDASWDDIQQTYRDLMRVWHPDRFPNDTRLQQKAQEQSQRINHAMSELRKLGKDFRPPPSQTSPPSSAKTTHAPRGKSAPHSDYRAGTTEPFTIPPLVARQRPLVSAFRMIGSLIIITIALNSLLRPDHEPLRAACAAGFLFLFLDVGIRNCHLLLLRKPIMIVAHTGLYLPHQGCVGWLDIQHVWPILSSRTSLLHFNFSKNYVCRQSIFRRALLSLRAALHFPHVAVSFRELNCDPVHVLTSMKLRQAHNELIFEEPQKIGPSSIDIGARLTSIACVVFVLIRCMTRDEITPLDWIPYMMLFVVCRVVLRVVTDTSARDFLRRAGSHV